MVIGNKLKFQKWEWDEEFVTMAIRDISYFLASGKKCFKHLVPFHFEHGFPDSGCAGFVTISRLQNEINVENQHALAQS